MKTQKAALRGKDIRRGNEKLVLRLIQKAGLLSQSEVVELTGLKAPTILRIFKNLEESGLIEISDTQKDTSERKGRKPVFYRLKSEALYVVGVEFWSLSATVVISNFVREPVYSASVDIGRDLDGEAVLGIVCKLIKDSIRKMGIAEEHVAGVGIGAPGKVDTNTGTVLYYSRIKGLHNLGVAEYLEDRLDMPVLVHNNCSVIAMDEYYKSRTDGIDNIMSILIRGGVGGAYINGGKVMTSRNITAMEIGHMSVDSNGRPCSCGAKGCLETYLSEEVILNDLSAEIGECTISDMDRLITESEPDSGLRRILDEKAGNLAFVIRNLEQLFSPDMFLLITRSMKLSEYLSERAMEFLKCPDDECIGPDITIKALCYNPLHAGMGACDIVFRDFFFVAG